MRLWRARSAGVVTHILSHLKQLTGEGTRAFREYLDMLETLSDNRDLKPFFKGLIGHTSLSGQLNR